MLCACGCGEFLEEFDRYKRPHKFIRGHNRKGKSFSKEHKENLSKNHADVSGENNPFYNKKHSKISREKISKTSIEKESHRGINNSMFGIRKYGENNPNWHGGERISWLRKSSKRRELGHTPLNKPFKGSDGHHINLNDVIYIPEEYNKIQHNVRTGKNMDIINAYAYFFLVQQNIGELNNMFIKEKVI